VGDSRGSVGQTSLSVSQQLARIVCEIKGTVTEFVEHLVGERIVADVVTQVESLAAENSVLAVQPGHRTFRRVAVLRGRRSHRSFVLAETTYVPARLPRNAQRELLETDEPIGRVLLANQLAFARVDLPSIPEPTRSPDGTLWARRYRLDLAGLPVMDITEWFLDTLAPFLQPTGKA
jgi:chorismate-pyruvate lyase